MYAPPAFRWNDEAAALDLAREFNFALMVTIVDAAPVVTHLPFLIDPARRVLRGHVARANPHSAHLAGGHLAVFSGPYAYISPDWYGGDSPDVPTWNYAVVHVYGTGRVLAESKEIDAFLADLSEHEERRRFDLASGGKVWTMDKIPPRDLDRMRRAIVAFEIDIASVEAKAKLSQNKPPPVAARACAALAGSGSYPASGVADMMRRSLKRNEKG